MRVSSRNILTFLTLLCLAMAAPLTADLRFKARVLESGMQFAADTIATPIQLSAFPYQLVGIEFTSEFENNTAANQNAVVRVIGNNLPDMLQNWPERSTETLTPGQEYDFQKVMFLHPHELGTFSFTIEASLFNTVGVLVEYDKFVFQVTVEDYPWMPFELPTLINNDNRFSLSPDNMVFLPGSAVRVNWNSTEPGSDIEGMLQNICYFNLDQPANLKLSNEKLYKAGTADARETLISDLENEATYGYLAKSIFTFNGRSYQLYSDPLFATQDQLCPSTVMSPHLFMKLDTTSQITWAKVEDQGTEGIQSGVAGYRIYRGIDTQEETAVEYVPVEYLTAVGADSLRYIDEDKIIGVPYYYRVAAVDAAGNEGNGLASNQAIRDGAADWPDDGEQDDSETEAADGYFASTVDTLSYTISNNLLAQLQQVRFVSVRDDESFLNLPEPPPLSVFNSGFIPIANVGRRNVGTDSVRIFHIFDYALMANGQRVPDLTQVSGHQYLRHIILSDGNSEQRVNCFTRIIDVLPPSDIQNLAVRAYIGDAALMKPPHGYQHWYFKVDWDHASDDASGVAGYHIYREISGVNETFESIDYTTSNSYIDEEIAGVAMPSGNLVAYRIVPIDGAGNRYHFSKSQWQRAEKALTSPKFSFTGAFAGRDTLISEVETIDIALSNIDARRVKKIWVSMNDKETPHLYTGQSTLPVALSQDQFSRIKIRSEFNGGRSSVWSQTRVVSMRNLPPADVMVINSDPDSVWSGNLVLQWNKASLDVHHYILERKKSDETDWTLIDNNIVTQEDTIRWTDFYGIDELTGEADALIAYFNYDFRVRAVDAGGVETDWRQASNYCARPPRIIKDELVDYDGGKAIKITWTQARPRVHKSFWYSQIQVAKNRGNNTVLQTDVLSHADRDTVYYYPIDTSRVNYIFSIKEIIPNETPRLESAWSKPYTVNYIQFDSLYVSAQPYGHAFVHWGNDPQLSALPVNAFRLQRLRDGAVELTEMLNDDVEFFMDSSTLAHGQTYVYRLQALNALNQVIAWGEKAIVADTGLVFIPEPYYPQVYFNGDSIEIAWRWKKVDGTLTTENYQGAARFLIQTSTDFTFPDLDERTITTGPLTADSNHSWVAVPKPSAIHANNEKVYCRITAWDRFNNPGETIWSPTLVVVYDEIIPTAAHDAAIVQATSHYSDANLISVHVNWHDESVSTGELLAKNIHGYYIMRHIGDSEEEAGFVPADASVTSYEFFDVSINQNPQYTIVSLDSAGNTARSGRAVAHQFVATPLSPTPVHQDSVTWQAAALEGARYVVEAASDSRHFIWAHEIGLDDENNRFLSVSDLLQSTGYHCEAGWASSLRDSTWFRIKVVSSDNWESGWSVPAVYTAVGEDPEVTTDVVSEQTPNAFAVSRNYPNPFNGSTTLEVALPRSAEITISLFNIHGRLVLVDDLGYQEPGVCEWTWHTEDHSGDELASGMYLLRVEVRYLNGDRHSKYQKLMYVK